MHLWKLHHFSFFVWNSSIFTDCSSKILSDFQDSGCPVFNWKGTSMMPPPSVQICLQRRVTFTFDLPDSPKLPLPCGPLVPVGIKISLKYSANKFGNRRANGWTNEWTGREHNPSTCQYGLQRHNYLWLVLLVRITIKPDKYRPTGSDQQEDLATLGSVQLRQTSALWTSASRLPGERPLLEMNGNILWTQQLCSGVRYERVLLTRMRGTRTRSWGLRRQMSEWVRQWLSEM